MQARGNKGIATEFLERAVNSLAPHLITCAPRRTVCTCLDAVDHSELEGRGELNTLHNPSS